MLHKKFIILLLSIFTLICCCGCNNNIYKDSVKRVSENNYLLNKNDAYIFKTYVGEYVTILKNNTYKFEWGNQKEIFDCSIDSHDYVYAETDVAEISIGYVDSEHKEAAYLNKYALLYAGFSTTEPACDLSSESVIEESGQLSESFPNEILPGRNFISKEGEINSRYVLNPEVKFDANGNEYKVYSDFVSTVIELKTGECLVISVNLKQDYVEDLMCKVNDNSSLQELSVESENLVNSCKLILDDISQYIIIGDYSDEYLISAIPSSTMGVPIATGQISKFSQTIKMDCGCEVKLNFNTNAYYVENTINKNNRCHIKHVLEVEDEPRPSYLFDATTRTNYSLDWTNFYEEEIDASGNSDVVSETRDAETTDVTSEDEAIEVFYSN